jgi:recA bacterial DNA recombination protein
MGLLSERFREKMGKLKDPKMDEATFDVMYPTGFLPFDFANGYKVDGVYPNGTPFSYNSLGIVDGSANTIIGRTGSGKTTFAIQAAANIVRPFENGVIFYDDIEGGSNQIRRERLTGFSPEEISTRLIYRNAAITAENFYSRIQYIYEDKLSHIEDYEYDTGLVGTKGEKIYKLVPTVYILDSLAMLTPDKLTEEEELSGQMSATATAKSNTAVYKRIIPKLKAANIILLVINHINSKVDINPFAKTKAQIGWLKPDETLPGGIAGLYLANNLIRIDDSIKIKESDGLGIDGKIVDFTFVKSRSNKSGISVPLLFDYNNGYDPLLSLYIFLKSEGYIDSKGAYMNLKESEIKFTQKNFKEKVMTDNDFAQDFQKVSREALNKLLVSYRPNDSEAVSTNSIINNILNM